MYDELVAVLVLTRERGLIHYLSLTFRGFFIILIRFDIFVRFVPIRKQSLFN